MANSQLLTRLEDGGLVIQALGHVKPRKTMLRKIKGTCTSPKWMLRTKSNDHIHTIFFYLLSKSKTCYVLNRLTQIHKNAIEIVTNNSLIVECWGWILRQCNRKQTFTKCLTGNRNTSYHLKAGCMSCFPFSLLNCILCFPSWSSTMEVSSLHQKPFGDAF